MQPNPPKRQKTSWRRPLTSNSPHLTIASSTTTLLRPWKCSTDSIQGHWKRSSWKIITTQKRIQCPAQQRSMHRTIRPQHLDLLPYSCSRTQDALFLTESGRQFEKGTIRTIPEFWATPKVKSDIRITATRMLKVAATTTVNNTDRDKHLVHQHMTHTEKTAECPYIRPDAATIAAAGHAVLKLNIGYCKSDDSDVEGTNKTLSEEDHALL